MFGIVHVPCYISLIAASMVAHSKAMRVVVAHSLTESALACRHTSTDTTLNAAKQVNNVKF